MNQKVLTAREVYQVLREAASGTRPLRQIGAKVFDTPHSGVMTIDIEGWVITLSRCREKISHCDSCFSPDGRYYDFQSPLNQDTDPAALLIPHELEQLEAKLSAVEYDIS